MNHTSRYYNRTGQQIDALVSFANLGSDTYAMLHTHRNMYGSVILDSGAYTDQNSFTKVDIDEYIDYIKVAGPSYDFYITLDSDFSDYRFSPDNLENLIKMERAGLHPVPVIHCLYPSDEIDYYIDRQYPIVALGSSKAKDLDELKYVFGKFEKYPHVKIHVFGTTSYASLIEVPAYSSDASSWTKQASSGNILWWNPEADGKDKTERIYVGGRMSMKKKPKNHFTLYGFRKQLEKYLYDTFQLTYEDLLGLEEDYNRQVVCMHYYNELAKRITEEHRKKGFIP